MPSPHPTSTRDSLQNLWGPVKSENVPKSPKEFQDCPASDRAWGTSEQGSRVAALAAHWGAQTPTCLTCCGEESLH